MVEYHSYAYMYNIVTFTYKYLSSANGAPVILLLFNAGPLDISWAKNSPLVSVIMECFFPAQATGEALYRMLTQQGTYSNPAARLPNTWPASLDQVPPPPPNNYWCLP